MARDDAQRRSARSLAAALATVIGLGAIMTGAIATSAYGSAGAAVALDHDSAVPAAFRAIDWKTLDVPSAACETAGNVALADGAATAPSHHWPSVTRVSLYLAQESYGSFGPGRSAAAADVLCSRPGGMADDQLADAWIVYTVHAGQLQLVGIVTPRSPTPGRGVHVSLIGSIVFHPGSVVADESWYKPSDPTCCPSGHATSTWSYSAGHLVYKGTEVAG